MRLLTPIVLVMALGCMGRQEITSTDHPAMKAFTNSKPIRPFWSKTVSPAVWEWDEPLQINEHLTLRVTGRRMVGGRLFGQFSDEQKPRLVASPGDYVYPCALSVDLANMKIYGAASGLAGGIEPATVLFEFDIRTRKIINSYHVDPKFLPPLPGPSTPAP